MEMCQNANKTFIYSNERQQINFFRSKDGAPLVPDQRRKLKITANIVQLSLENVEKSDAGLYKVMANSPLGSTSRDVELRVRDFIDDDSEPPAFLRRLNDLSVKVGTRNRFLVEIRSCSQLTVCSKITKTFSGILSDIYLFRLNGSITKKEWRKEIEYEL